MNTATQINTDDLVKYAHQYITYDIIDFCNLHEDPYHCVASAINDTIQMSHRLQSEFFYDYYSIEVCEDRQIAFVDFSIESIKAMSETALEERLQSTMRHLNFHTGDDYVTATTKCWS